MFTGLFQEAQVRRKIGKQEKELLHKAQRGKCNYCGRKLGLAYHDIDHKTPIARGGFDGGKNLQLLCGPCNTRKGDMTDGEFRRRYKLTPARKAKRPPPRVIPQKYFEQITKDVASRKAKLRRREPSKWF